MFIIIFQRLLIEAIGDIIYFPVWWYSRGLILAVQWSLNLFKSGNAILGPGLWLKNIFVPMFGQYDWRGRIISFFMRLANVIGRGLALVVWLVLCLVIFSLWPILPLIMLYSLLTAS